MKYRGPRSENIVILIIALITLCAVLADQFPADKPNCLRRSVNPKCFKPADIQGSAWENWYKEQQK